MDDTDSQADRVVHVDRVVFILAISLMAAAFVGAVVAFVIVCCRQMNRPTRTSTYTQAHEVSVDPVSDATPSPAGPSRREGASTSPLGYTDHTETVITTFDALDLDAADADNIGPLSGVPIENSVRPRARLPRGTIIVQHNDHQICINFKRLAVVPEAEPPPLTEEEKQRLEQERTRIASPEYYGRADYLERLRSASGTPSLSVGSVRHPQWPHFSSNHSAASIGSFSVGGGPNSPKRGERGPAGLPRGSELLESTSDDEFDDPILTRELGLRLAEAASDHLQRHRQQRLHSNSLLSTYLKGVASAASNAESAASAYNPRSPISDAVMVPVATPATQEGVRDMAQAPPASQQSSGYDHNQPQGNTTGEHASPATGPPQPHTLEAGPPHSPSGSP